MKIFTKKNYVLSLYAIFLIPNLFVVTMGIESFPYTQAPMFGHYINEDTNLYILKFEGHDQEGTVDLIDYYGKTELRFIRHFFSKAYGSSEYITPFSGRVLENPDRFQERLQSFFENYGDFLWKEHRLRFQSIEVKIARVDKNRNLLSGFEPFGIYDFAKKKYKVIQD